MRYTKRQSRKYRQQYYCANKNKALEQKRENYECNADIRKEADKQMYRTNSDRKQYAQKKAYSLMLMKLSLLPKLGMPLTLRQRKRL